MKYFTPEPEQMDGPTETAAAGTLHSDGNAAKQTDIILDQLPAGQEAGTEASFKQKNGG